MGTPDRLGRPLPAAGLPGSRDAAPSGAGVATPAGHGRLPVFLERIGPSFWDREALLLLGGIAFLVFAIARVRRRT
jgi:hypothetical protein